MLLAHRIRIDASASQRDYFARAAGTARRVWNWALAEWQRQMAAGRKPNAMALKKQFNGIKYSDPDWLDENGEPWLRAIHRDAHSQPFVNLAKAWTRYFEQRRAGVAALAPRFKRMGRSPDAFYIANDKFRLEGMHAVLPKVGRVALREALRWPGRIMGASVSRQAGYWFLSVRVDVPDHVARASRTGNAVIGVDLGVSAAATLSSGEKLMAPRPLKAALRRLRIRGRRQSRKLEAAKLAAGMPGPIPKGTRLPVSKNRTKGALALARLHARIARVRRDFTHKLTTRLCRENQAVVIEDLNVKGMLANARLARAIADVGFYEIRRQLHYKALRYGTEIVLADRWYPSSKLCSDCGMRNATLSLGERAWTCGGCGAHHDRDVNAAINLQRLATGAFQAHSALPVASQAATPGTAAGLVPAGGGKVTPVRHEHGQQDGSGQEENGAHFCSRFRWQRCMHMPERQGGFTLVELTAVVAIIGTLTAVALPRYADIMRSARMAKMEAARGAVREAARMYHVKWILAGSPAAPTILDDVEMNGSGYPTSAGILVAAGIAEDFDTRVAGVIAADPKHPACSLAYAPATGSATPTYAGDKDC